MEYSKIYRLSQKTRYTVYNYIIERCLEYRLSPETTEAIINTFERLQVIGNSQAFVNDLIIIYSALYSDFTVCEPIKNLNFLSVLTYELVSMSYLHTIDLDQIQFRKLYFYLSCSLFSSCMQKCTSYERFLTCLNHLCNENYITFHSVQNFIRNHKIRVRMGNIRAFTVQFCKFLQKLKYTVFIETKLTIKNARVRLDLFHRPVQIS